MNGQRDSSADTIAERALAQWGLAGASLTMINHSENITYRVTPNFGAAPSILRLYRNKYHSLEAIESELSWIEALSAQTSVRVPAILPGIDGRQVQIVDDPFQSSSRYCALFSFIEGEEPGPESLVSLSRPLGEIAARLHSHAMEWQPPSFFRRPSWDFEHALGAGANWGDWRKGPGLDENRRQLLERLVDLLGQRLKRFGKKRERFGLIHADLRLANLILERNNIAVIDFDDCGWGWFLYDAAAIVSFFEDRRDIPEFLHHWCEGYRKLRPLSSEEENELMTFVMLRRMILLAWMGSHRETILASAHAPLYAAITCDMAERYLSRHT